MAGGPYISVVVAARNDDHGGNLLGRMQAFLDSWIGQSNRYGLSSEVIVVEWNPPAGKGKLSDVLRLPPESGVRFIEVPATVHQELSSSDAIPLHQMIAKNVGVRRARGEFILASNVDIVFSSDLMQFLARRSLERGKIYRIDRHDVSSEIPADASLDELLSFCETHKLRIFTKEGGFTFGCGDLWNLDANDIVAPDAGIHLQRGWYPLEPGSGGPFRWMGSEAEIVLQEWRAGLLIDVETGPSAGGKQVELEVLEESGAVLGSISLDGRSLLRLGLPKYDRPSRFYLRIHSECMAIERDLRFLNLRAFGVRWDSPRAASNCGFKLLRRKSGIDWTASPLALSPFARYIRNAAYLHTNGSGDFTLMAREDWFALRGYAEFRIWPMHIDSLLCYAAHHAGLQEVVLEEPMRIFHIEHRSGAGWTPEGEAERQARIEETGAGVISYADFTNWINQMRRFDAPMIFNADKWGLGGVDLLETTYKTGQPSPLRSRLGNIVQAQQHVTKP